MTDLMAVALTGTFTLAAGLGGVYLSGWVTQRRDAERVRVEDERRWLGERRSVYARYLGLVESMLQEVDRVALLALHEPDVNGHLVLPADGHGISPAVDNSSPQPRT